MTEENDLISAIRLVCDEKNISIDSVINTIEAALAAAYRKDFGEKYAEALKATGLSLVILDH